MGSRGILGFFAAGLADFIQYASAHISRIRDHSTRHTFVNRVKGSENLIVVLAGYKSYLWPATLTRMKEHAPVEFDFCVVSSGIHSKTLEGMCAANDWSYLSIARNSPGVAINRAIKLHPSAEYIFKLDEDIFIASGFFEQLQEGYEHAHKDSRLEPGFCAPVLNLNGISYLTFLHELGLVSQYCESFGSLISRCENLPVHNNPDAAAWIWKQTLPFDTTAARFAKLEPSHDTCSTRFSIGAILFRREFFDSIHGFRSAWHSGILGVDEDGICRDCVSKSRPMCIIRNVLAGHFSFYPQEAYMRHILPEMAALDPATFPPEHYAGALLNTQPCLGEDTPQADQSD